MQQNHILNKSNNNKIKVLLFCIILITVLSFTLVNAAEQSKAVFTTNTTNSTSFVVTDAVKQTDLYDINSSDTDVKFVLEALARQSKSNIVISPEVNGQVNLHLSQQPIESILDYLSAIIDLGWSKDGSTYLINTKSKMAKPEIIAPEKKSLEVWECHNVKPSELVGIISKMFPKIVITEGPGSFLPNFREGSSDTENPVYSYQGENPDQNSQPSTTSSNLSTNTIKQSDKIILLGTVEDLENAKTMLALLDVKKRQVNIELAITEIKTTDDKQIGIDWTWDTFSVKQGFTAAADSTSNVNAAQPKFLAQPWNFNATLSLMIKNGTANLLAKPNISVLDGESARIFLGNTVRYLQLDSRDRDGRPIYRTATVDAGISLPIAPRILSDNSIMLTLHPSVSLITGYSRIEGSDYPQVSTREVETTVTIKNGEMLAIGGLIRDEDTNNASKVPIMGGLANYW